MLFHVIEKCDESYILINESFIEMLRNIFFNIHFFSGQRPENDEQWPRIVRAALKRSNHTICRMCTANGELKEEIFTKYKHGKYVYIKLN